jgi:hypothetical protein
MAAKAVRPRITRIVVDLSIPLQVLDRAEQGQERDRDTKFAAQFAMEATLIAAPRIRSG